MRGKAGRFIGGPGKKGNRIQQMTTGGGHFQLRLQVPLMTTGSALGRQKRPTGRFAIREVLRMQRPARRVIRRGQHGHYCGQPTPLRAEAAAITAGLPMPKRHKRHSAICTAKRARGRPKHRFVRPTIFAVLAKRSKRLVGHGRGARRVRLHRFRVSRKKRKVVVIAVASRVSCVGSGLRKKVRGRGGRRHRHARGENGRAKRGRIDCIVIPERPARIGPASLEKRISRIGRPKRVGENCRPAVSKRGPVCGL